jgi:flagellar basal-body rod modification protein FlgD
MDSMQFTAQLAQFSQLEQMFELNDKMESVLLYEASLNSWQGLGMIDKEVDALGDWIELSGGAASKIGYRLEESSSGITVQIFDASGKVVRNLDEGAKEKGDHLIDWDGRDDNGNPLPDGRYTVSVTGEGDEEARQVMTFVRGIITGVSFEGGVPLLLMGAQKIPFANVMEVRNVSEG